jgi:hypothetical protein
VIVNSPSPVSHSPPPSLRCFSRPRHPLTHFPLLPISRAAIPHPAARHGHHLTIDRTTRATSASTSLTSSTRVTPWNSPSKRVSFSFSYPSERRRRSQPLCLLSSPAIYGQSWCNWTPFSCSLCSWFTLHHSPSRTMARNIAR